VARAEPPSAASGDNTPNAQAQSSARVAHSRARPRRHSQRARRAALLRPRRWCSARHRDQARSLRRQSAQPVARAFPARGPHHDAVTAGAYPVAALRAWGRRGLFEYFSRACGGNLAHARPTRAGPETYPGQRAAPDDFVCGPALPAVSSSLSIAPTGIARSGGVGWLTLPGASVCAERSSGSGCKKG